MPFLNVDAGEGTPGELLLIAQADAVNIACGGHAGDDETMSATLREAHGIGVACGAHPGYEDRVHFGRRSLDARPEEIGASVARQISHLADLAAGWAIPLTHVKLHGALYHDANRSSQLATAVLEAVSRRLPGSRLLAPPHGELLLRAPSFGLIPIREGFADRRYGPDGNLWERTQPGAVISDPEEAAQQALRLSSRVQTICIHGDSPNALALLKAVRAALVYAARA